MRFNNKTLPNYNSNYEFISEIQSKMLRIFGETKENLRALISKYRDYYNKKKQVQHL